jgi:hypothetical protein
VSDLDLDALRTILREELASIRGEFATIEEKLALLPDLLFLCDSATAQEVVQALRKMVGCQASTATRGAHGAARCSRQTARRIVPLLPPAQYDHPSQVPVMSTSCGLNLQRVCKAPGQLLGWLDWRATTLGRAWQDTRLPPVPRHSQPTSCSRRGHVKECTFPLHDFPDFRFVGRLVQFALERHHSFVKPDDRHAIELESLGPVHRGNPHARFGSIVRLPRHQNVGADSAPHEPLRRSIDQILGLRQHADIPQIDALRRKRCDPLDQNERDAAIHKKVQELCDTALQRSKGRAVLPEVPELLERLEG